MAKLYVLVAEGYFDDLGTETYIIGIYDDPDKLAKAQDDYVEMVKKENLCPGDDDEGIKMFYTHVLELELNETYPLSKRPDTWAYSAFGNDFNVGGYLE